MHNAFTQSIVNMCRDCSSFPSVPQMLCIIRNSYCIEKVKDDLSIASQQATKSPCSLLHYWLEFDGLPVLSQRSSSGTFDDFDE